MPKRHPPIDKRKIVLRFKIVSSLTMAWINLCKEKTIKNPIKKVCIANNDPIVALNPKGSKAELKDKTTVRVNTTIKNVRTDNGTNNQMIILGTFSPIKS